MVEKASHSSPKGFVSRATDRQSSESLGKYRCEHSPAPVRAARVWWIKSAPTCEEKPVPPRTSEENEIEGFFSEAPQ